MTTMINMYILRMKIGKYGMLCFKG